MYNLQCNHWAGYKGQTIYICLSTQMWNHSLHRALQWAKDISLMKCIPTVICHYTNYFKSETWRNVLLRRLHGTSEHFWVLRLLYSELNCKHLNPLSYYYMLFVMGLKEGDPNQYEGNKSVHLFSSNLNRNFREVGTWVTMFKDISTHKQSFPVLTGLCSCWFLSKYEAIAMKSFPKVSGALIRHNLLYATSTCSSQCKEYVKGMPLHNGRHLEHPCPWE